MPGRLAGRLPQSFRLPSISEKYPAKQYNADKKKDEHGRLSKLILPLFFKLLRVQKCRAILLQRNAAEDSYSNLIKRRSILLTSSTSLYRIHATPKAINPLFSISTCGLNTCVLFRFAIGHRSTLGAHLQPNRLDGFASIKVSLHILLFEHFQARHRQQYKNLSLIFLRNFTVIY